MAFFTSTCARRHVFKLVFGNKRFGFQEHCFFAPMPFLRRSASFFSSNSCSREGIISATSAAIAAHDSAIGVNMALCDRGGHRMVQERLALFIKHKQK